MIDNGLDLDFIDQKILVKLVKSERTDILKILFDHGIDVNILNNLTPTQDFNKYYDLLIDLDIDPKKIAYIIATDEFDSDSDSD